MKQCTTCTLPETHETITFNEQGSCNVCQGQKHKHEIIDWDLKKEELKELIEKYRGSGEYDCLIPFSGGKDSTFTAYYLIKEFNLKPLIVCFDHGFLRPKIIQYRIKTLKKLGADFHQFTPNYHVIKKLMLESLKRKGDFCWHCHTGIFAYPMQVAVKYNIPLIFWGERSSEYTAYYSYDNPEEVDEKRFNRYINLGINAEDMVGFLDESVTMRDLAPFKYPALKDLKSINYRSVCLGSYIRWDTKKQSELIKKELDWNGDQVEGVPPEYFYEKIECMLQGVRDWCKYIKRGYSRMTHLSSIAIRNGRLSREQALEMIKEYEGKRPKSLDYFLEFMDMSEEEFMQIILQHQISPYVFDSSSVTDGKKLWDHDKWDRTKVDNKISKRDEIIKGNRVYLRELCTNDASEKYANWLNDPIVNQYLETRSSTIEEIEEYIKSKTSDPNSLFVGIFDINTKNHIGNMKFEPINWSTKEATIGILIGDKNYWGKGIATEATHLFIKHAFEMLGLKKIKLGVDARNKAAIRVYEKLGFKQTGFFPNTKNNSGIVFDNIKMKLEKENIKGEIHLT